MKEHWTKEMVVDAFSWSGASELGFGPSDFYEWGQVYKNLSLDPMMPSDSERSQIWRMIFWLDGQVMKGVDHGV